jgi:prolyl-tRNA synthetase
VVVSDRGLKAGTIELQGRRDSAPTVLPLGDAVEGVRSRLGR